MKKYITIAALAGLVTLGGVTYTQSQKKATNALFTLDFSEGSCSKDTDCSWASQGCGGGHGICTNTPDKYKHMLSTCEINENFPSNKGYSCGCVEKVGKCGWKK